MPLAAEAPATKAWPKDYQVTLTLTIRKSSARKDHRPFVAVWAEDEQGQPVRTISLWANERKYFKDLSMWWKFAKDKLDMVRAVTRATRPAGRYTIAWDGLDDAGKPVPPGKYKICVESNREKGTHSTGSVVITCAADKAEGKIDATREYEDVPVMYGPRGDKP